MSRPSVLSLEQREQIIADAKSGQLRLSEIARKYGISVSSAQHWWKKAGAVTAVKARPDGMETDALRRLRSRNKRLLELLARLVEGRPKIFEEIGLLGILTQKYPDAFLDAL